MMDTEQQICQLTGLKLVRSSAQRVWRVARTSYGALNPLRRNPADVSRQQWGRWDPPGAKTIYASQHVVGSYMETLGWSRPSEDAPASKYFTDAQPGETLHKALADDWSSKGTMSLWSVPASWREGRSLYKLGFPKTGWFVNVVDTQTLSRLTAAITHPEQRTISALMGENQDLTTRVGEWIRNCELFDNSRPVGVIYPSKFGLNQWCYAAWLAEKGTTEQITILGDRAIEVSDADYRNAASLLHVIVH